MGTGEIVYVLTIVPDIVCMWFKYFTDYLLPYGVTFAIASILLVRFDRLLGVAFGGFAVLLFWLFMHAPGQAVSLGAAPCPACSASRTPTNTRDTRRLPGRPGRAAASMGRLHERLEELLQKKRFYGNSKELHKL
jgi:hypothetical protein